MGSLANLSDQQTQNIITLFNFFDTDRDQLISPRSAVKLCERLGFHPEPAQFGGDPGSSPLALQDLLSWVDTFCGQCGRSEELRLAQRFALLRSCDVFASGQRVSREALEAFLESEQHSVQAASLDALLQETGTDGHLTKSDLLALAAPKKAARRPQAKYAGEQRM